MENAYIESINGKFRLECLNQNWFATMDDGKAKIVAWRLDYNRERPQSSLGNRTPESFAQDWEAPKPVPLAAIGRGS